MGQYTLRISHQTYVIDQNVKKSQNLLLTLSLDDNLTISIEFLLYFSVPFNISKLRC